MIDLRLELVGEKIILSDRGTASYLFIYDWKELGSEDQAWEVFMRVLRGLRAKYGDIRIG